MKTRRDTLSIALATAFLGSACNGAVDLGRNDGTIVGDDSGSGGSVEEGAGGTESSGGAPGVDAGEGAGGIVGNGGGPGGGGAGGLVGAPVDGGPCESGPEAWSTLIQQGFSVALAPGEEIIYCVRETLAEAVAYRALGSINPSGTRHVGVSYGPPSGPDVTGRCDATTSQPFPLYEVGGAGTLEVRPPDGMSSTIAAGEQILLRHHVINTTNDVVTVNSVNDFTSDDPGPVCLPDATRGRHFPVEWELNPGEEAEFCLRHTAPEAFDYRLLWVENPAGTVESVLSVGAPNGPDGFTVCSEAATDLDSVLSVAGPGTWSHLLPSETRARIEVGQQLLFRVHAVNVTDRPLSAGSSYSFAD